MHLKYSFKVIKSQVLRECLSEVRWFTLLAVRAY